MPLLHSQYIYMHIFVLTLIYQYMLAYLVNTCRPPTQAQYVSPNGLLREDMVIPAGRRTKKALGEVRGASFLGSGTVYQQVDICWMTANVWTC